MDPADFDETSNSANVVNRNHDDPYANDILEPVEMDMENSDEEPEDLHRNSYNQQSVDHYDNNINSTHNLNMYNNNIDPPDASESLAAKPPTDNHDYENSNQDARIYNSDKQQHKNQQLNDEYGPYCNPDDDDRYNNNNGQLGSSSRDSNYRDTEQQEMFRIIQVVNVAPSATIDQFKTLFSYIGDISNIELYHSDHENPETNFKVCFVEFVKPSSVSLALHLTNTVFIDRALIILPYPHHEIPAKEAALDEISGSRYMTNFDFGVASHVIVGPGGLQYIATMNPRLTALGLSQYPQLPISTDPIRLEEIRRTVYIGNLDSTLNPDEVLKFFNDIGEVKYIRMAGDDTQPTRFAFVEFTNQSSVANAIQQNGFLLGSRALKINHSNNAIVKPQPKIVTIDDNRRHQHDRGLRDDRRPSSRDERRRDDSRDRHRDYHRSSTRHDRNRDRSGSRHREDRSRDSNGSRRRDRSRDDRNQYYDSHRRGGDSSPSSRNVRRSSRSRDRAVSSSRRRSNSRDRSSPILSSMSSTRHRRSRSRSRDRSSKIRSGGSRAHDSKRHRSRSPSTNEGHSSSSRHHHKRSRR